MHDNQLNKHISISSAVLLVDDVLFIYKTTKYQVAKYKSQKDLEELACVR